MTNPKLACVLGCWVAALATSGCRSGIGPGSPIDAGDDDDASSSVIPDTPGHQPDAPDVRPDAASGQPDAPDVRPDADVRSDDNVVTSGSTFAFVDAMDAISVETFEYYFDFGGDATIVQIDDFANACADATNQAFHPHSHYLYFALAVVDASKHAVPVSAPGVYPVSFLGPAEHPATFTPGNYAQARYVERDDGCYNALIDRAMSGTIEVTSVVPGPGGRIEGTFTFGFHNDEDEGSATLTMTGHFSAPNCAGWNPTSGDPFTCE